MARSALPSQAHWIESDGDAYLQWICVCIATVKIRDGKVVISINRTGGSPITGTAPSVAKGMLYVERWLAARNWSPMHPDERRRLRAAGMKPVPPLPRAARLPVVEKAIPFRLRPGDADLIYHAESRDLSNN